MKVINTEVGPVQLYNKSLDKNIPQNAVYLGRPGPYGNPFVIGSFHANTRLDRQGAIRAYTDWLLYSDEGQKILAQGQKELIEERHFVCWCVPQPCHGEILIKWVFNV